MAATPSNRCRDRCSPGPTFAASLDRQNLAVSCLTSLETREEGVPARDSSPRLGADHRLEIIIRLDDFDQAILGGTVAAIGVGMVLLDQRLVLRLDVFERRIGAQAHHLQRLALGVEYLARLRLGLGFCACALTRAPAPPAMKLAEHIERIGRAGARVRAQAQK